jgi:hypothetical protein
MTLLAVDLGLRTGLACFNEGALVWFRSQNMGTLTRLKKAIPVVLDECEELSLLVVEGDRHLGDLWAKLAVKRGAEVRRVSPEVWRAELMLPREMRTGAGAKLVAQRKALEIIDASACKRPRTPLVDDVAEAICIGAWAVATAR